MLPAQWKCNHGKTRKKQSKLVNNVKSLCFPFQGSTLLFGGWYHYFFMLWASHGMVGHDHHGPRIGTPKQRLALARAICTLDLRGALSAVGDLRLRQRGKHGKTRGNCNHWGFVWPFSWGNFLYDQTFGTDFGETLRPIFYLRIAACPRRFVTDWYHVFGFWVADSLSWSHSRHLEFRMAQQFDTSVIICPKMDGWTMT